MRSALSRVEKKDSHAWRDNAAQWVAYWALYGLLGSIRGVVEISRPAWTMGFEIVRSMVLVVAGGPWLSKVVVVSISDRAG